MPRSTLPTPLPLKQWATLLGIDPFNLAQLVPQIKGYACDDVFYQYHYQRSTLSRDDVANAILAAADMVAYHIGAPIAPTQIVGETTPFQWLPAQRENGVGAWQGAGGLPRTVGLRWGRVQGVGKLTRTLIQASVPISYADGDGDNIRETFTTNAFTTDVPLSEIALYIPADKRMDRPLDDSFRLRPVFLSASGTSVTARGHISSCVLPSKQESYQPDPIALSNDTIAANCITAVDVYRVRIDTTQQAQALYEAPVWTTESAVERLDVACTVLDSRLGHISVTPKARASYSDEYLRNMTVDYVAGYPLDETGQVQHALAQIVAYLSATLLPTRPCGCEETMKILEYWREKPKEDEVIANADLNNPWGVQRGAVFAWRQLQIFSQFGGGLTS
jgi:hypothetical protein